MTTDPFSGVWRFQPAESRWIGTLPAGWMQDIEVTGDRIVARERIQGADGSERSHAIDARFDGAEYPVVNSPLVDTIAYTRPDRLRIEGTARKSGVVVFREVITVSADAGVLTATLSIPGRDGTIIENVAVFSRQ